MTPLENAEGVSPPAAAISRWRSEPFRLFFPLGVFFAWIGVGHWLLYATGVTTTYSCRFHGLVQMQAFTYWAPWLELSERYYEADAATLAASLIAEPPRGYESGSDHFFRQSSRTLLESMLGVATPKEPRSIPKLLWEESPALVGLTDAAQA